MLANVTTTNQILILCPLCETKTHGDVTIVPLYKDQFIIIILQTLGLSLILIIKQSIFQQ